MSLVLAVPKTIHERGLSSSALCHTVAERVVYERGKGKSNQVGAPASGQTLAALTIVYAT